MSVRAELPKQKADLTSMSLHAVVKGREPDGRQWKEVADLISVSSTGSSFQLGRGCDVGTLISFLVPLPAHLRCYDHDREFYKVWGLVQHCELMTTEEGSFYFVGVAFTGREAPDSYDDNPEQHYRIIGVDHNGMWAVAEASRPFKKRAQVRFWTPVDLYLALVDIKSGSPAGERTTTENVSRSGAAVFSTLDVGIGDRVKFICAEFD